MLAVHPQWRRETAQFAQSPGTKSRPAAAFTFDLLAIAAAVSRRYVRVLLRRLASVRMIMSPRMTIMTPARSRTSPILWMLNPEVCTEVASLRMAPTAASTSPKAAKPMPEFLLMGPKCRPTSPRGRGHGAAGRSSRTITDLRDGMRSPADRQTCIVIDGPNGYLGQSRRSGTLTFGASGRQPAAAWLGQRRRLATRIFGGFQPFARDS